MANTTQTTLEADTLPVRNLVTPLPALSLMPPYEMRTCATFTDHSSISNPLGTPTPLIDAMNQALTCGAANFAADREGYSLKSSLSTFHNLPTGSFIIGSSTKDLIRAVAQTYQPCSVGITTPSEVGYALAIGNAGHTVVDIAGRAGFLAPEPSLSRAQGITFDAALLGNPSYPTSRLLHKSTLISYLETCSWVIVDESSIELTLAGESYTSLTQQYKNLIIIRSISVSMALPGIPMSYLVAHPSTVEQIESFYDSSSVSLFAEVISPLLIEHNNLEKAREFLESEIPWLQCMLSLIPGIDIFPAEGNYVMCSYLVPQGMDLGASSVEELEDKMRMHGFLIRKLDDIRGLEKGRYFCVSVRTREENEKLVEALRHIILEQ